MTARGISLSVLVGGERDGGERILRNVVLVHKSPRSESDHLSWREQPVRKGVCALAFDRVIAVAPAKTPELPLRQGPVHDHVIRVAGIQRRRGGPDRAAHQASTAPRKRGVAYLLDAERRRKANRLIAIIRVGDETVDLANVDACVDCRVLDRLTGQPELGHGCAATLVVGRLANADDRHSVANGVISHEYAGAVPSAPMSSPVHLKPCRTSRTSPGRWRL